MQAHETNALPGFLKKILEQRGFVSDQEKINFLYPSLSQLKDPYSLSGMEKAVDRLLKSYKDEEKICIYADFDLDGTSGLALLYEGLLGLGFKNLITFQPRRIRDGYGFHKEAVDMLKEQGVQLIVTVDVGITAHEATRRANELKLDVIITDHHLPQETLPEALSVVNPNTPYCASGLGYLSGAGVAFYLLRALKRRMHEVLDNDPKFAYHKNFDLKSVLDFFTIGTLTDMVPLIEDNRVLVRHGVSQFSGTQRPGLREMLKVLSLNQKNLTGQDIAIRFAPKLNALSRMDSDILPADLLLVKDSTTAKGLVKHMMEQNTLRQKKQQEAEDEALAQLSEQTPEDFIFVYSKNFHLGVVGLVATKLVQRFQLPAWIGSMAENGVIKGSSRLPAHDDGCLVESMSSASEHLVRFGGHSKAAGFELHETQTEGFREKLKIFFKDRKEKMTTEKKEIPIYDLTLSFQEMSTSFLKWYDFAGPYGAGFPIPQFLFENVEIKNIKKLKGGHLKLTLDQGGVQNMGMAFQGSFSTSDPLESLLYQKINLIGEVQGNYFRGETEVQILIKKIYRNSNAAIQ